VVEKDEPHPNDVVYIGSETYDIERRGPSCRERIPNLTSLVKRFMWDWTLARRAGRSAS
jgi:hypothetical protein